MTARASASDAERLQLCWLCGGWGQERLGGQRLFELSRQLGLAASSHAKAALNPCPHPMA
jgi:hypothetical protein